KSPVEEPFLKSEPSTETPIDATTTSKTLLEETFFKSEVEEQKEMNFDWEVNPANLSTSDSQKEGVVRFMLEDDSEEKLSLEGANPKTILSPEEQQRRTQDRLSKIQEYTAKLKKADGITEFENEPAYVRRNIQLDNSRRSTEESLSRFGLSEDENGTTLRNNNFLHDNVD
ncbi:MAG: cell division protein FtsZ, partial [Flavobacteriia bacterium]